MKSFHFLKVCSSRASSWLSISKAGQEIILKNALISSDKKCSNLKQIEKNPAALKIEALTEPPASCRKAGILVLQSQKKLR